MLVSKVIIKFNYKENTADWFESVVKVMSE